MYKCKDKISNLYFKRHVDQIIKEGTFYNKVYNDAIPELIVPQTFLSSQVKNTNDNSVIRNGYILTIC